MRNSMFIALSMAALAGCAATANAGRVVIDQIGGGITLNSGDLSATVFGGSPSPAWSTSSLASVHAALNADGVVTDGKVTTLLADTDQGLALLVLIDSEMGDLQQPTNASMAMQTFGHGLNLAYINDIGESMIPLVTGPASQAAFGSFAWDSTINGDGFGWAELNVGNVLTFRFDRLMNQPLGLDDPGTFQFVNWNGTDWEVVNVSLAESSFSVNGEFGFTTVVIPLPSSAVLAGLPFAALALHRRRR